MGCGASSPTAVSPRAQSEPDANASSPTVRKPESPVGSPIGSAAAGSAPATPGPAGRSISEIKSRYTFGKLLGRGGFGEVHEATRKSDGKRVAIKTISKLKFAGEEERQNMLTEVQLMQRCMGHTNVVEILEWSEDHASFCLVLELCTGGELMDAIVKSSHFSEKVAARFFRQITEGLRHIHSHLVVHRDLKPENFLLASSAPDAPIKITDFGLSCAIAEPDAIITDACGSAYYIAPEVFTKQYTKAADVWAAGIILFLLLSGTVPFGADADAEVDVYRAIQRNPLRFGPEWNTISSAARELVTGLLEKDPAKRYTLDQALAHPWVTGEAAPDAPMDKAIVAGLFAFNNKNKFKKAALKLVASTLGAADVSKLREAFHRIDSDNTGFITFSEMAAAMREYGVTDESQITALIKNLDADGDGRISYEEFLLAVVDRQMVHHQNAIWWAFCKYDLDGDGRITVDELKQVMSGNESPDAVAKYIAEYDRNGDGVIDYEEFMRMLLPKDIKIKIAAW